MKKKQGKSKNVNPVFLDGVVAKYDDNTNGKSYTIEWEGGKPSEHEGILLTKRILAANGCKPAQAGDGPFEYKAG